VLAALVLGSKRPRLYHSVHDVPWQCAVLMDAGFACWTTQVLSVLRTHLISTKEHHMNTQKSLSAWFDTVMEALSMCFEWLPPGSSRFKVAHGGVHYTYYSIPGDHFQLEWGTDYTIVYFLTGRIRRPDRFVSLQTKVDHKIWLLSLDGLLRRDPLLRPDSTPNHPVLTQSWDAAGHWTGVKIDLSDTEYVEWKSNGNRATAGQNAARFPDQVHRAADHVRDVMNHMNQEYQLHGHIYVSPEAITQLELDLRNYAHIDPDAAAETVVNASQILPFCEAVRRQHTK